MRTADRSSFGDRDGRTDWLYGNGATTAEKGLVWLTVLVALPVIVVGQLRTGSHWHWWHWLLAAVLTADVVGGVVANSLVPAKRLYHEEPGPQGSLVERLLRHHIAFAALHVHPFIAAAVFPGVGWAWAGAWYVTSVLGVTLVVVLPASLKRPAAMGVVTLAVLVALLPDGGDPTAGIAWLGPVLVLKLVVAHAVPERAPLGHSNSGR